MLCTEKLEPKMLISKEMSVYNKLNQPVAHGANSCKIADQALSTHLVAIEAYFVCFFLFRLIKNVLHQVSSVKVIVLITNVKCPI